MSDSATAIGNKLVSEQGISAISADEIIDDAIADLFPGRIRDLMRKYRLTESQAVQIRETIRDAKKRNILIVGGIVNGQNI